MHFAFPFPTYLAQLKAHLQSFCQLRSGTSSLGKICMPSTQLRKKENSPSAERHRPETQGPQLRSNWEKDYGFGTVYFQDSWNSATKVKAFFRFRTNMHFITGKATHISTMIS